MFSKASKAAWKKQQQHFRRADVYDCHCLGAPMIQRSSCSFKCQSLRTRTAGARFGLSRRVLQIYTVYIYIYTHVVWKWSMSTKSDASLISRCHHLRMTHPARPRRAIRLVIWAACCCSHSAESWRNSWPLKNPLSIDGTHQTAVTPLALKKCTLATI